MQTKSETYFDQLYQVRDQIAWRLEAQKAELLNPTFFSDSHSSFIGVIGYGETRRECATLYRLKGKPTGKAATAIIYRDERGRYELTFYIA